MTTFDDCKSKLYVMLTAKHFAYRLFPILIARSMNKGISGLCRYSLLIILFLFTVQMQLMAQYKRMVPLGSSTTLGTGASVPDSGWAGLFGQYYKCRVGLIDSVYNLGLTAGSFYHAMPNNYTPPPLRPYPNIDHNISRAITLLSELSDGADGVVIVNFPSNGYLSYSFREIMDGLQLIYDSTVAAGNRCFITTTQPRSDGGFATHAAKKKLADVKDSIINRFGVANTINFWDGMFNPLDTTILAKYSCGDKVHFNNAGHRELFERVVAKNVFALPVWYSKPTGQLDVLETWGNKADGTGTIPASFNADNQTFHIVNNPSPTIGSNWTLGGKNTRLVIGDGISPVDLVIPEGLIINITSPPPFNGCN